MQKHIIIENENLLHMKISHHFLTDMSLLLIYGKSCLILSYPHDPYSALNSRLYDLASILACIFIDLDIYKFFPYCLYLQFPQQTLIYDAPLTPHCFNLGFNYFYMFPSPTAFLASLFPAHPQPLQPQPSRDPHGHLMLHTEFCYLTYQL